MTKQELIVEIIKLQSEAGRLGLWRTMHALDAAKEQYGRDMDPKYAAAKEGQ